MNKEQFLTHIETHLNEQFPAFQFKKNEQKFALNFLQEGKQETFYLSNLFKEYQHSDIENVLAPIVSFFTNFHNKDQGIPTFNRTKITPIVRPFSDQDVLSEEVTDDLSLGYAIEHDDHIQYIDSSMVTDLFNEKKIKEQAKQNLLKKEWVFAQTEEHSHAGRMFLFRHHEEEFLAQFFFSELAEPKLGRDFYLITPTKHIAFVLIPNRINPEGVTEGLLKLKEFAVKLHLQEAYSISEKVYHILNGSVTTVG